ncbi:hypothetical protein IV203_031006 [Nitzschia inconspicua]|uniref:Uncharacterized protein n=1 Tax=Nitzschia inconspicua TaxID=303405 RepID=A0A9K3Q286_9STRA|nr:hypothetical protein IV203_031006 [Nitzschia inconspicua]
MDIWEVGKLLSLGQSFEIRQPDVTPRQKRKIQVNNDKNTPHCQSIPFVITHFSSRSSCNRHTTQLLVIC